MDKTLILKIEGMHCTSCEDTLVQVLMKVPGVTKASVHFLTQEAEVTLDKEIDREDLIKAIAKAGYHAHLKSSTIEHFPKDILTTLFSLIFTLPLLFQMGLELSGSMLTIPLWAQFLFSTIVQFIFGWPFYRGSYYALKNFTGNMDLLIALGTSAAYFYSLCVYFLRLPYPLYFESSAVIITLVLIGRYLESITRKKTLEAMKALLSFKPEKARIKHEDHWMDVFIEEVQIGHLFLVRPGERIPVDGIIVDGKSTVDESMLTGESSPISKLKGDKIYAGTYNQYGMLIGKAEKVGPQTILASIICLVNEASRSKAAIQNLADKVSAIFIPVVLFISLVTFFLWLGISHEIPRSLIHALSVVVIACPCSLGLAVPTVIMVATGIGAKKGIFIKNANTLEKAKDITMMAFDKTGTLTQGKLSVKKTISKTDDYSLTSISASLASLSKHPYSEAISKQSKDTLLVEDFKEHPGRGLSGTINGKTYFLGSLKWMQEKSLYIHEKLIDASQYSVVALADEGGILGYFLISDTLRKEAIETIALLEAMNIEVCMLTGDDIKNAKSIGQSCSIKKIYARLLPEEKLQKVCYLQQKGYKVGVVGDGINDAPVLAKADVGFSMKSGTDIANSTSDITLMQNDLRRIPDTIDLSRFTFMKIKQNLFFAFFYNCIGIPLAAFGLLNPILSAIAMTLSSLTVIGNALLLHFWQPKVISTKTPEER